MRKPGPAVFLAAGLVLPGMAAAGAMSDDEALAILSRHCAICHAASPTHSAFAQPPKNIKLETIAQLKRYARLVYQQTVETRAMPLGNRTGMTDQERAALGQWVKDLP